MDLVLGPHFFADCLHFNNVVFDPSEMRIFFLWYFFVPEQCLCLIFIKENVWVCVLSLDVGTGSLEWKRVGRKGSGSGLFGHQTSSRLFRRCAHLLSAMVIVARKEC